MEELIASVKHRAIKTTLHHEETSIDKYLKPKTVEAYPEIAAFLYSIGNRRMNDPFWRLMAIILDDPKLYDYAKDNYNPSNRRVSHGFRQFMIVVPTENPNSHNYPLDLPCMIYGESGTQAIRIDGSLGNNLERLGHGSRLATLEEIEDFFEHNGVREHIIADHRHYGSVNSEEGGVNFYGATTFRSVFDQYYGVSDDGDDRQSDPFESMPEDPF